MGEGFAQGMVHDAAADVRAAIEGDPAVFARWQALTPIGRNEFLCWIEDAKQAATRQRRIGRAVESLREGKMRPCCWPGCIHRTDKAPGKWQQAVLIDAKR
ncbi:YdeI/OmpD-associated family protein [Sphingomonas sp. Leaf4]|uniref:YdeI/OmpD-associated family protein n=1 Tax=Sphingomonas sp. Leaf4 TaxID=2876553 RepID=UPI001E5EABDE|nr:YdeI/OmpD-associated family protein [Sphingomonas sp. Leaf4]